LLDLKVDKLSHIKTDIDCLQVLVTT
jgi:hypothetical protein